LAYNTLMFTPWIKRKSLKRSPKSKRLVMEGERPSMITLVSVCGLLVVAGVFVVQQSWAGVKENLLTPAATVSVSPTPTPTPTPAAYYGH
jgi:hypothetical protein